MKSDVVYVTLGDNPDGYYTDFCEVSSSIESVAEKAKEDGYVFILGTQEVIAENDNAIGVIVLISDRGHKIKMAEVVTTKLL